MGVPTVASAQLLATHLPHPGRTLQDMGSALKIGRVASIDVNVHWTFFLLVTFFAFSRYEVTGSLALPVVEGSKLVGMLTIEDVGHARLLGQPTTMGGKG